MMNVMIISRIAAEHLERVPRERVSTMVVERLACRNNEEECRLSDRQARNEFCDGRAECIEAETFDRMVVQGSVGIGYVQSVMAGVEGH